MCNGGGEMQGTQLCGCVSVKEFIYEVKREREGEIGNKRV